jgi:hypothetical protein
MTAILATQPSYITFRLFLTFETSWDLYKKAVPQHTYGGAGGEGCIAPTHLRPQTRWG